MSTALYMGCVVNSSSYLFNFQLSSAYIRAWNILNKSSVVAAETQGFLLETWLSG